MDSQVPPMPPVTGLAGPTGQPTNNGSLPVTEQPQPQPQLHLQQPPLPLPAPPQPNPTFDAPVAPQQEQGMTSFPSSGPQPHIHNAVAGQAQPPAPTGAQQQPLSGAATAPTVAPQPVSTVGLSSGADQVDAQPFSHSVAGVVGQSHTNRPSHLGHQGNLSTPPHPYGQQGHFMRQDEAAGPPPALPAQHLRAVPPQQVVQARDQPPPQQTSVPSGASTASAYSANENAPLAAQDPVSGVRVEDADATAHAVGPHSAPNTKPPGSKPKSTPANPKTDQSPTAVPASAPGPAIPSQQPGMGPPSVPNVHPSQPFGAFPPPQAPSSQAPPVAASSNGGAGVGSNGLKDPGSGPGNGPSTGSGNPSPMGGIRELRVEDALLYLDQVKMEFKDRPQIYNQFLAIMKNFKTQEVDTPGVIRRVSQLFRGYNSLILGFNTFLPEGFKISLADLKRQELQDLKEQEEAERRGESPPPLSGLAAQARSSPISGPPVSVHHGSQRPWNQKGVPAESDARKPPPKPSSSQPHRASPPSKPSSSTKQQAHVSGASPAPNHPPPASQHQAVEFDHAISYVTKIKRRFASDPSTYHSFLEILHTYQKEQRGIKEVLEQVAHLFQDHPDLLKEFTFFLPDAVQEQAKERLHRAAAESEARQAVSRQQQQMEQYQSLGPSPHAKFIDMTRLNQNMELDGSSRRKRLLGDGSSLAEGTAQPETYVYNSAVERQFFDMARESLTSYARDGGQAWAEFLKCLDMYAQDILSRNEMLNFVEPLLGKRNTKLFEEFKRILNAAGSATQPLPLTEDSWYSVPLSEIDFSRCRRCTPSYRALPRDYPAPPCSGRSEDEAKVLNDVWVSLPVGSEESYTFRHMRRNTYEETLFRVEDERFEIDMAIDSNASTLRRLESIAEEIAQLAQDELVSQDLGTKVDGAGLGARRFQYTFDKTILGVINRNAVARIYGDSGSEMLDLLVKNPAVAIPVVVQRMRQKDIEWRGVRERLNRHWKELAQHNYYKSLDHRSLTWRTFDKRATSARTLQSEIKDRAANGGSEGVEALKQKMDKAKEEHGTFYEVTMGETLSKNLDLTYLPKPDRRLFTPHLSLMYENNSWAQRDAYRILAFALERGHISPADKERCHRLWTELLGPFFGLSLNWMQRPAVSYQETAAAAASAPNSSSLVASAPGANASVVSEDDDEDSVEEDLVLARNVVTEELPRESDTSKDFTDHHPLPPCTRVSTLYGEGKIVEFRRSDHIYVVELEFGGRGYLRPATVLCSLLPVEKSAYTVELRSKDVSKLTRHDDQLVIGTQSLYLFFRLHQILVRRLNIAKQLAYSVGEDRSMQTLVEQMPDRNMNAAGRRRYEAYLSLVYALVDGGVGGAAEGGKYEDRVRGLLGHGAFELATMDKLISHIWKNIQTLAGEETTWNLIQLYRRQLSGGGFKPESFRQEAAYHSEGEPMYAFQYCPVRGKDAAVLHFEYLGVLEDSDEADEMMEDDGEGEVDEAPEPRTKRARR